MDVVVAGRRVSPSALLVLFAVAALAAALSAPDEGFATGLWPAGVAAAALLATRSSGVGSRWTTSVVVLAVSVAAIAVAGRPLAVALTLGVGAAAGPWCAVWLLVRLGDRRSGPDGERLLLQNDHEMRVYLGASIAGAAVAAVLGAVTSIALDWGPPLQVASGLGLAHLASYLTLLPLAMQLSDHEALADRSERVLQWALIVVLTTVIIMVPDLPSLVFLLIPMVVWGALRDRPPEALAQMLAQLAVVVVVTTSGRGPFADAPARFELDADARGMVLSAFVITCAVVLVPLIVRVGEYAGLADDAQIERDRLRRIVDNATGVAIIGADAAGRITHFNPGAERLLGYARADVEGRSTAFLHTPDAIAEKALELGVPPTMRDVAGVLVDRELAGTHLRFLREDGVERVHAMTLSRIVDTHGRAAGFVSTSEDVTDLVDARRAMAESFAAEQRALERLREAEAVKDALVSTVSHELRTPITSIVGYLELLEDGSYGELAGRQADAVCRVSANSRRLLALIDDLLTMSRLDDGGVGLTARELDLRRAVETALEVVAAAVGARHEVSVQLPADPVVLTGDCDMIERVVVNLLGNAIKFSPDGGRIDVEVSVAAGCAVLRVQDCGIGIPTQEQAQLFQRFFRSRLAQEHAIPGSGLGLSICRAVVERHRGTIEVRSTPGEGTLVEVTLPTGISNFQLPLEQTT